MNTDTSFASLPATYTVPEFCAAHRITRGTLQKLLQRGLGPRLMCVGNRTLISVEAARDWRARMESLNTDPGASTKALRDCPQDAA